MMNPELNNSFLKNEIKNTEFSFFDSISVSICCLDIIVLTGMFKMKCIYTLTSSTAALPLMGNSYVAYKDW